ncbi:MAG TPA: hypothetical protein VH599_09035 [Ktedonobacterales bacterium]|jgi:hypothetical protein
MNVEEYGMYVWRAGDIAPAGTYLRVDNNSFRVVVLEQEGRLPASYDGHIALYCRAPVMDLVNAQFESNHVSSRSQQAR